MLHYRLHSRHFDSLLWDQHRLDLTTLTRAQLHWWLTVSTWNHLKTHSNHHASIKKLHIVLFSLVWDHMLIFIHWIHCNKYPHMLSLMSKPDPSHTKSTRVYFSFPSWEHLYKFMQSRPQSGDEGLRRRRRSRSRRRRMCCSLLSRKPVLFRKSISIRLPSRDRFPSHHIITRVPAFVFQARGDLYQASSVARKKSGLHRRRNPQILGLVHGQYH